jgi:hypothetical protein
MRHKDVSGSVRIAPLFIISALDASGWSASRSRSFTSGKTVSHCIVRWLVPRDGLDVLENRKIPSNVREIEQRFHDRPSRNLVAIPTDLSRLFDKWTAWLTAAVENRLHA